MQSRPRWSLPTARELFAIAAEGPAANPCVPAFVFNSLSFVSKALKNFCFVLKMTRLTFFLGVACALAAASGEPVAESPEEFLADVVEEDGGVYVEFDGDDVIVSVPPVEGYEAEEGEALVPEDEEGDSAVKRELCLGHKCVKVKARKHKHYKKKKHHYKKYKKYAAPVPYKYVEPPTKARAAPIPTKVVTMPSKSMRSSRYASYPTVDSSNLLQRLIVQPEIRSIPQKKG